MIIPIVDTHRLPYIKGQFTAMKLGGGVTTPVHFYDSDGNDLGLEIFTNSDGFVCDSNGNLLGNGVFVHTDAVISGHYHGGRFVQWVTRGQEDNSRQVNDGKLRNENGDVIWSANAAYDHTLHWNDIAGKPAFNAWEENEQDVIIEALTTRDNVIVNKFTKVMVVVYNENLSEVSTANLTLIPQSNGPQRFGQVIFVQVNPTKAKALQLWNEGDSSPFCVVHGYGSALISLLSNGKFVCLEVSENDNDLIRVETTGSLEYNVSDSSQTVVQIYGTPQPSLTGRDPNGITYIKLKNFGLSKPRRIVLWWQPTSENSKYLCRVQTDNGGQTLDSCDLYPYRPMEVTVYPAGNELGIATLGIEKQVEPLYAELVLTQNGTDTHNDIKSNVVALPTACTRVRLVWDVSSIQLIEGGGSPDFHDIIKVPPKWKGDVIIMGGTELKDAYGSYFTEAIAFFCGRTESDLAYLTNNPDDGSAYIPVAVPGKKFAVMVHIESNETGGIVLAQRTLTYM